MEVPRRPRLELDAVYPLVKGVRLVGELEDDLRQPEQAALRPLVPLDPPQQPLVEVAAARLKQLLE